MSLAAFDIKTAHHSAKRDADGYNAEIREELDCGKYHNVSDTKEALGIIICLGSRTGD